MNDYKIKNTKTYQKEIAYMEFDGDYKQLETLIKHMHKVGDVGSPIGVTSYMWMYILNIFGIKTLTGNIFTRHVDGSSEICVRTKHKVEDEKLQYKTLEMAEAIQTTHYGSYDSIKEAHEALKSYARENNLSGTEIRELYVTNEGETNFEDKFETVVQLILE